MSDTTLERMRDLIQADPGKRGLRTDPDDNLITACPGDFAAACRSIAEESQPAIVVVTGFFIPTADPPAGETDGPLGAIFLARALVPARIEVAIATDQFCVPAVRAGLESCGLLESVRVIELPAPTERWDKFYHDQWGKGIIRGFGATHVVALERVGPSHDRESIRRQVGLDDLELFARARPDLAHTVHDKVAAATKFVEGFLQEVPSQHRNRYHTMRGRDITDLMSPAHRLFPSGGAQTTIGIGDGGNEIGMGKIPWDTIRRNIPGGAITACCVPTDHLIVCGVSNWGVYALARGVLHLRGQPLRGLFDAAREQEVLRVMVEQGPLVDGVLGRPSVSVDGLAFEAYAEVLERLGDP
jgi:hypothetical protein